MDDEQYAIFMCNDVCEVQWTEPDNHGNAVLGYILYYAPYTKGMQVEGEWRECGF